ncbi:hypothetical protein DFQ30_004776, partial [Apophysomyces sp. BC1015]
AWAKVPRLNNQNVFGQHHSNQICNEGWGNSITIPPGASLGDYGNYIEVPASDT